MPMVEVFKWSDLKNKATIKKLGKVVLNDINPKNQFAILNYSSSQTYHIIGGYVDNSFKIYKEGQPVHTIRFHKVVDFLRLILNLIRKL